MEYTIEVVDERTTIEVVDETVTLEYAFPGPQGPRGLPGLQNVYVGDEPTDPNELDLWVEV